MVRRRSGRTASNHPSFESFGSETDAVSLLGAVIDPASAIRLASLQVSLVVLAIQQMGGIRLSLDV